MIRPAIHSAILLIHLIGIAIFNYVGFPAYMKPFAGGGWKNVYKLDSAEDFFKKHSETGQLVMLLQEEIVFEEYYRCYCIGGKYVRIMPYEPRNPHHLRYVADFTPSPERLKQMEDIVLRINQYLGYDFNTVELALRDGVPYAIDFCNPAPDAERTSVGEENFEWVVETAANYAIEKALNQNEDGDNLTWGEYVKRSGSIRFLWYKVSILIRLIDQPGIVIFTGMLLNKKSLFYNTYDTKLQKFYSRCRRRIHGNGPCRPGN